MSADSKGADLKREVSRNLSKAKYVVLAELIERHEFSLNGMAVDATWLIRHSWKGSVSSGQALLIRSGGTCIDGSVKGDFRIFYLTKMTGGSPFHRGDPDLSGAINAELAEHMAVLDEIVPRRLRMPPNISLQADRER